MTGTARSKDRGGRVAVQSMAAAPASVPGYSSTGQTTKRPGGSGRPIRLEGPAGPVFLHGSQETPSAGYPIGHGHSGAPVVRRAIAHAGVVTLARPPGFFGFTGPAASWRPVREFQDAFFRIDWWKLQTRAQAINWKEQ
jgi:hypothetical protein